MREAATLLFALFVGALLSGSLGAPAHRDEVPFDAVKREHFDAIAVARNDDARASAAPLVVRVHVVGDASDADIAQAEAWLRAHANVILVRDSAGAPLFLTTQDLSATSGRSTLGATLPSGMAAEVGDPRLAPCVVAHEALHFLGLKHVNDRANLMHPQCTRDKLDTAILTASQRAQLDELTSIVATTPRGVQTWAAR